METHKQIMAHLRAILSLYNTLPKEDPSSKPATNKYGSKLPSKPEADGIVEAVNNLEALVARRVARDFRKNYGVSGEQVSGRSDDTDGY